MKTTKRIFLALTLISTIALYYSAYGYYFSPVYFFDKLILGFPEMLVSMFFLFINCIILFILERHSYERKLAEKDAKILEQQDNYSKWHSENLVLRTNAENTCKEYEAKIKELELDNKSISKAREEENKCIINLCEWFEKNVADAEFKPENYNHTIDRLIINHIEMLNIKLEEAKDHLLLSKEIWEPVDKLMRDNDKYFCLKLGDRVSVRTLEVLREVLTSGFLIKEVHPSLRKPKPKAKSKTSTRKRERV